MIDVLSCPVSVGKVTLARGPANGCSESRLGRGLTNGHGFDWSKRDLALQAGTNRGGKGCGAKTALVFWALESPASGGSPSRVPLACLLPKRGLVKTVHVELPPGLGTFHSRPLPYVTTHLDHHPSSPAQELDDIYQDAASNVLLALCRHSWPAVAKHLETELLTGVFPHRSLLYVMGILISKGMFRQRMDQEAGNRRKP